MQQMRKSAYVKKRTSKRRLKEKEKKTSAK